ncbi:protein of unknown function [Methylocaldum szegediense]|uniref:Uncharacterized protein n=1 Tax=Methylocaldum szegediense TaxID=73780 RepID=A0ABM9I7Z0_9GAMM|nr:protein of unknown function [Methylocaldum szegediense]
MPSFYVERDILGVPEELFRLKTVRSSDQIFLKTIQTCPFFGTYVHSSNYYRLDMV